MAIAQRAPEEDPKCPLRGRSSEHQHGVVQAWLTRSTGIGENLSVVVVLGSVSRCTTAMRVWRKPDNKNNIMQKYAGETCHSEFSRHMPTPNERRFEANGRRHLRRGSPALMAIDGTRGRTGILVRGCMCISERSLNNHQAHAVQSLRRRERVICAHGSRRQVEPNTKTKHQKAVGKKIGDRLRKLRIMQVSN